MPDSLNNPFQPGAATAPPHFSGRGDDLKVFQKCWQKVRQGTPPGLMALVAPRGQGKTVLMNRMAKAADKPWILSPSGIPDVPSLLKRLSGLAGVRKTKGLKAWVNLFGVAGGVWDGAAQEAAAQDVSDMLRRAAHTQPVLILVDEAHTLDLKVGQALLQGEQAARGQNAKTQVILAGTPDLPDHVGQMQVTFWDRLSRRLRHLQLLDAKDSMATIAQPLRERRGLHLDHEWQGDVMRLTSGYPYFLQLLGEAIWDTAPLGAHAVTAETLQSAEEAFLEGKTAYYEGRADELARDGLLGAAFATAVTWRTLGGAMPKMTLGAACRHGNALKIDRVDPKVERTPLEMTESLQHLGFVWRVNPSRSTLMPGIPTLMDHIHAAVLAAHPDAERRLMKKAAFRRDCLASLTHEPS